MSISIATKGIICQFTPVGEGPEYTPIEEPDILIDKVIKPPKIRAKIEE